MEIRWGRVVEVQVDRDGVRRKAVRVWKEGIINAGAHRVG
jgi:hypothetical protein